MWCTVTRKSEKYEFLTRQTSIKNLDNKTVLKFDLRI